MWRGFGQWLNWLACHLVAIGFLAFLLVAVLFRGPLFGLSEQAVTGDASAAEVPGSASATSVGAVNKPSLATEANPPGRDVIWSSNFGQVHGLGRYAALASTETGGR